MVREILDEQLIKMFKIRSDISKLNESVVFEEEFDNIYLNASSSYVKYTSMNTMYKMLESDSIFAFCSELSNDKTENKMLKVDASDDAYISCFYNSNPKNNQHYHLYSGDVLSQWTSYCRDGGASFEFYFGQDLFDTLQSTENQNINESIDNFFNNLSGTAKRQFMYSLMSANSAESSDFVLYPNFPFQVQYYENAEKDQSDSISLALNQVVNAYHVDITKVLPYIKHSGFVQESEARLVFINEDDRLSDCIKFLTSGDGSKIPYIEVKFGNNDLLNNPCEFVKISKKEALCDAIERKIRNSEKVFGPKFPIVIPQGRDQENIYNEVEKIINVLWHGESSINKPPIICQGHLPITKIILAPTEDRSEQRKKMEIFCKSKYWLRNVKILESKIPYNTNNLNHT